MKKLKIGVIGTGIMGLEHCDSCQKLDEVELTAVCDIDEAAAKGVACHYKVKAFTDYKKLIDSGAGNLRSSRENDERQPSPRPVRRYSCRCL